MKILHNIGQFVFILSEVILTRVLYLTDENRIETLEYLIIQFINYTNNSDTLAQMQLNPFTPRVNYGDMLCSSNF